MARNETDRDDLMKEAVALHRRAEFASNDTGASAIGGFRPDGCFSVYFGQDLMFQFDASGRLRRAFANGYLYRSDGTMLAQLHRQRTETETLLLRVDLKDQAVEEFRKWTLSNIRRLAVDLAGGSLMILNQIPEGDEYLVSDIRQFLECVLNSSEFLAPAISKRR